MNKILLSVFVGLALLVGASACEQNKPGSEEQHASADAKPGSHEDWCVEHAVPESQCTQCHSELIAAFKATGDWCDEHGLPKSHCKKCDPSLVIKRPPKTATEAK